MLRIRIRTPIDPDVVCDFPTTDRVTFGRAPDNDLVLDSTYVSRSHGALSRRGDTWSVSSWGSRTPLTLRRGSEARELPHDVAQPLRDGDVLQILHTRLEISLPTATEPARIVPPEDPTVIRTPPPSADLPAALPFDASAGTPTAPHGAFPGSRCADASPPPGHHLEAVVASIREAFLVALELRSPQLAAHGRRTADYAVALATRLRQVRPDALSDDDLRGLHVAALLHDVGKLTCTRPSSPGTGGAAADPSHHASHGSRILSAIEWPESMRDVPVWVGLHHERLDGSGYPDGLGADALPLPARILQIADVLDAHRTRGDPAPAPAQADLILAHHARAGRLDPDLIELWLDTNATRAG